MHTVYVIPGHGASGMRYDTGVACGQIIEAELTRKFSSILAEELTRSGVRHQIIDAGKERPAPSYRQRIASIEALSMPICVHFDAATDFVRNGSLLGHNGNKDAVACCEFLAPVVQKWGHATCSRYGSARIEQVSDPALVEGSCGLYLSLFSPDGPDAILYASRVEAIARIIGFELAREAARLHPAILSYATLRGSRV